MKIKYLFTLFSFIFICICLHSQNINQTQFINLYNEQQTITLQDTTFVITFSSLSCHDCYLQISNFLVKNNLWDNPNVHIFIIVSDNKDNLANAAIRKFYYNSIQEYFPQIQREQVLFNSNIHSKKAELFNHKFNIFSSPKIFIIIDNKITVQEYDNFINLKYN
jgi:hypothetical protein